MGSMRELRVMKGPSSAGLFPSAPRLVRLYWPLSKQARAGTQTRIVCNPQLKAVSGFRQLVHIRRSDYRVTIATQLKGTQLIEKADDHIRFPRGAFTGKIQSKGGKEGCSKYDGLQKLPCVHTVNLR